MKNYCVLFFYLHSIELYGEMYLYYKNINILSVFKIQNIIIVFCYWDIIKANVENLS